MANKNSSRLVEVMCSWVSCTTPLLMQTMRKIRFTGFVCRTRIKEGVRVTTRVIDLDQGNKIDSRQN